MAAKEELRLQLRLLTERNEWRITKATGVVREEARRKNGS